MAHNRKFCLSSTSLIMGRIKNNTTQLMKPYDVIEEILIKDKTLDPAPFRCISLMYRYGLKNRLEPEYEKVEIHPKYNEVSIAIELQMEHLIWCDKNDIELLYEILMIGGLDSVIHVCERYGLNTALLKQERQKYRHIPETLAELEAMSHCDSPVKNLIFLSTNETPLGIKDFHHFFLDTLNTTTYYDALKDHIQEMPLDVLQRLIDKKLEKSELHKPQCDELLALWHKNNDPICRER